MSTNILCGNSAVTQNEILNKFNFCHPCEMSTVGQGAQVGAGHSSLFKFFHPSIHIAAVQSTIHTNRHKFSMNITTIITFCINIFMMARCSSRENYIIISIQTVTYRNYISVSMHWPPGDRLVALPKTKLNRSLLHQRRCTSYTVTIKIYALILDCTSTW